MRATDVYVPNINISTPISMIAASLKKVRTGTRPSPSVVRVRIWMKIGKIMASAVQPVEPTSEMKLSSCGILTAMIPEMKPDTRIRKRKAELGNVDLNTHT